ncbi:L-lactate MFS transporter [Carboxydothermus hydrogenoformans]|uniref:Putative transporter n=1 Tax=Carboxydothermus hydrogenoformans (strain ATCC BAA-161 / DSM 6008 / Z-2901) TaxID=246194 RepID=Q3AAI3_CARHZ|nr:putative transporter [Carboxydothermus hydrogenoformans Z-2901]
MGKVNKGILVTAAGTGINLMLGVLYSWSVIKKALVAQGWSNTQAAVPYTVACAVFAIIMVFAGRLQDQIGPRKVATVGGILIGSGMILGGLIPSLTGLIISFGILAGTGIGLGYAAATPAAVKWFGPEKKGLITGIVVSGFGLASVYISPLTTWFLNHFGLERTFIYLGMIFLVITVILAQLLTDPPAGYRATGVTSETLKINVDFTWQEMLKTYRFYLLWLMFAFSASAGLMIIGHITTIAKEQANWEKGFWLVALLAIFNASGRILAGMASDRIGRVNTMLLVFLVGGVNMLLFGTYHTIGSMAIGTAIAGLAYGALLSLFPSATADYYGTKNLGVNYGLVFTAWGIGGVLGPLLAGKVVDLTGNYLIAYKISAALLGGAVLLALLLKIPRYVLAKA